MVRTQCGQMATIFWTFCAVKAGEAGFSEGLEDEVVAQAAGGVAGAFLFAQHAKDVPRCAITRAKSATISRPWGS